MSGRLFLVDGYALIYRAFFAMIARPLTTSRGENTSVAWGITNFLLRLRERHSPEYVAWVHDAGTSFRHERLPSYKATREKLDEELQQDFDRSLTRVEQLLAAFRIPLVALDGYEADDVIATMAERAAGGGTDVVIVSGDKDFHQLVSSRIALLNPGRGGPAAVEEHLVTTANASERLGVPPERTVDYLALVGDSADNVPGVTGVGDKTARRLIAEFGDLEAILSRAPEAGSRRISEALAAQGERARLSRDLVTLRRDAPVKLDLDKLAVRDPDWGRLVELCRELEFTSLARTLDERVGGGGAPAAAPGPGGAAPCRVADTPAAVNEIVGRARARGVLGVCVAASSSAPLRGDLVGLGLATAPGETWYLPFAHGSPGDVFETQDVLNLPPLADAALAALAELLADSRVPKIGHDLKHGLLVLRRAGVALGGLGFDTMLASYVLDPGRRTHALDAVVLDQFAERIAAPHEAAGRGRAGRSLAEVPVREAAEVFGTAAGWTLRLRERLEPQLADHRLATVYSDIEMPLIGVLADMEWEGIAIDGELFARLASDFRLLLGDLEHRIHAAAGTEFNLLSTPQLRHVLFEKLQLPVLKKTKTGASTDADVLDELAAAGHELPRLLLEYREVSKLLSTYVESLPQAVNPATGRIHTSFYQIGAATGRLSSADPNLQNIPVRTARGAEIRRGFVPRPGWKLIVADYSQIELRLLAHLSGDPAFLAAFRAGGDIHRQTAAIIFGVAPGEVTAEQRARAKTINFATIYGQGAHSLSRQLGIGREEAKEFIEGYFERFAGVRSFLDGCVERARERGFAETLFGRRRYIAELKDRNFNTRSFGERTAANSPLQGSAADLIKIAMVRVAGALRASHRGRLLLQVHDELVLEAPAAEAGAVAELVKRHMQDAAKLDVPLVADVGIGDTWLDAKAG